MTVLGLLAVIATTALFVAVIAKAAKDDRRPHPWRDGLLTVGYVYLISLTIVGLVWGIVLLISSGVLGERII